MAWARIEARRRTLETAEWVRSVSEKDPQLAALLRQMYSVVEPRQVIARAAARHGLWCGLCAVDLGAEVYRSRIPFAGTTVPVCLDCEPYRMPGGFVGVCSCGRKVYGFHIARTRIYCCTDHRADQVNAARRARRARRRGRSCATCGTFFVPPRSDGWYCSPKCRQKAYRQRRQRQAANPDSAA